VSAALATSALGSLSANAADRPIDSWGHGSWSWFADPRAVRVTGLDDKTFVAWIDWEGRVTVGSYDRRSGEMRTHVVGYLFHDDHGNPAVLVEPDNRLTVFWSGHNGSAMHYRTSSRPEEIRRWGPVRTIRSQLPGSYGFTYPNPVLLSAERRRLYLFWRGAAWTADYERRTVTGRWSRAGEVISNPGQRPYVKVDSNGRDRIAIAFTDGHPREEVTSIYYALYRRGWLRHASGRRIRRLNGNAISPGQADLVYDGRATGVSSWVWDVALGSGHPVIVYATFPSAWNHAYWYARWTGRRWVSHFLTFAGPTISPGTIETEYSGGLALDHAHPSTVYLSRKVRGWFEIEKWTTHDGGYRWTHSTIVRTPGADDIRPVVTRGSDSGPMSLLWLHGHYGTYSSYRTSVDFLR
jgi:BNR repeat-containing family member